MQKHLSSRFALSPLLVGSLLVLGATTAHAAPATMSGTDGVDIKQSGGTITEFRSSNGVTIPLLAPGGFVKADVHGTLVVDPTGPVGPEGPTGPTGPAGPPGPPGPSNVPILGSSGANVISGAIVSVTQYAGIAGMDNSESAFSFALPVGGTLKNLRVKTTSAPGVVLGTPQSYSFTVRVGGSDTVLKCNYSGASNTSCSDIANTVTGVSAGAMVSLKVVASGGAAPTRIGSWSLVIEP